MKKIADKFNSFLEILFGFTGVLMILTESYAVLARNVLKISAPWTDEVLKLLFAWLVFVGAAIVFYTDETICLTIVEDSQKVKNNVKLHSSLKIFQYVVAIIVNAVIAKALIQIIGVQMSTGETTTVIQYPLYLLNMGMFFGVVLTTLYGCLKIYDKVLLMRKGR